jgi:hypothetical protein
VYRRRFLLLAFAIVRPFGVQRPPSVRPGFQASISVADVRQRQVPQWHRGHCYLHPSFLIVRASLVRQMGVEWAFHSRRGGPGTAHDTCEGITRWCTERKIRLERMRVDFTGFPWDRWDSEMVPGGGARLVGEHGEHVVVGHVMRYGLAVGPALFSHLWALPLGRSGARAFSRHDPNQVVRAYLDEPLVPGT